jgi:hypothetical protein
MGSKDTAAVKPATATATAATAETATTTKGGGTAEQEKAAAVAAKEATGSGKLYIVASPIKHDGYDYAAGDEIRLPEATAHRLAGYLKS